MTAIRLFALLLTCALLSAGCHLPAQVAWSPDGKLAGYRVGEQAYVIDENGKELAKLGQSGGGFAWTADSKTLYFAADRAGDGEAKPKATVAGTRWVGKAATQPAQPATQPAEPGEAPVSVFSWTNGKIEPHFGLAETVLYMELSPDQKWLALVAMGKHDDENRNRLYVYNLAGKQLDVISENCRPTLCFTGPHRLAYVELLADTKDIIAQVGERDLNEKAAELKFTPLVDVLGPFTPWVAAAGEDVLFTAIPKAFPGQPFDEDNVGPHKLYQYTRKNKGLAAIAEDVGERFLLSPDGKRILFEKISPAAGDKRKQRHLAIMNANGSDAKMLAEMIEEDLPVWPAWKDASQISYSSTKHVKQGPAEPGGTGQSRWYDVVLYRIDTAGLTPVRNLSETWEQSMKPAVKVKEPAARPAATAPAAGQ